MDRVRSAWESNTACSARQTLYRSIYASKQALNIIRPSNDRRKQLQRSDF